MNADVENLFETSNNGVVDFTNVRVSNDLHAILDALDVYPNVAYINWAENAPLLNSNKHLKFQIYEKLADNLLKNPTASQIIDLSRFELEDDYLKQVYANQQQLNNKTLEHVIFGERNEMILKNYLNTDLDDTLAQNLEALEVNQPILDQEQTVMHNVCGNRGQFQKFQKF
jgi:hypothetical protein